VSENVEFEVDCFLSILGDIKTDSVTFVELGAGYAEWCLALAGVVKNNIIPLNFKNYRCIAVEADPQHKSWAVEHFLGNKIAGTVVEAAISDKNGTCSFAIDNNPADCYGQSITVGNSFLRTIGNTLRRKKITVKCLTLKTLMEMEEIEKIDLIHMDVQGAESRVVRAGMDVIKQGLIKYWLIGTHGKTYNKEIMTMLSPYYNNIVNLLPDAIGMVSGNRIKCQDGIQVWKLK